MNSAHASFVPASSAEKVGPASSVLTWAIHLTLLALLAGLLTWFERRAVASAVQVWWISPTYSHCFLVIPVSAYVVWRRRGELKSVLPSASLLPLLVGPAFVLLWIAGEIAGINEAQQFAYIALLQVMIAALLGIHVYRKILFPCLFLFFLVPTGDYLVEPLQRFTTIFVTTGLRLAGIVHYAEGYIIQLSNGAFEVAEACAGLRFLIATLAIGVLFAQLTYSKWYKWVIFLLACLVVPVIANGFRALGIVLVAHRTDNRIAAGVDHIVYGWGFLVGILLVLMVIGMRYADPLPKGGLPEGAPRAERLRLGRLLMAAGLALATICFAPGFLLQAFSRASVTSGQIATPVSLAGWQAGAISGGWSPKYPSPDQRLSFAMREPGLQSADVDVFVSFYAGVDGSQRLLDESNNLWSADAWHSVSEGTSRVYLGQSAIAVRESVIASGGLVRVIWSTYWTAGRFTPSARLVKLASVTNLFSHQSGAALLAVSTVSRGDLTEARTRLTRAYRALGAIELQLEQASRN